MRRLLITACCLVWPLASHAAPPVVKPLASYPLADRVWLGTFGGEVEVNPLSELPVTRTGEIRLLANDGMEVKEGAAVALADAEKIQQSADQLALDESALPVKLKTAEWSHQEKTAGLERQLEELEARIAKLTLSPKERQLLGEDLTLRLAEEGRKLQGQLATMHEKLAPEFRAEELRIEQQQLRQDIERKRAEHLELVRSMEITAPHDGVFHALKSGKVRASEIIGTVERRGKAAVTLQLLDPELRSETPESLAIAVSSPTGEIFTGKFSHIERVPGIRLGPAVYHFTLDVSQSTPLRDDLSGDRMVTLYKLLGRQTRIVAKVDFLFSHAAEIQQLGWAGFLRSVWPDARVIHVGPRSIALAEHE
jgi:hypothetical protein